MGIYKSALKTIIKAITGNKYILQKVGEIELYNEWKSKYGSKIKALKNKHKGETCILIGNGPSLNHMDLSVLKNYRTIGLNKIHLIEKRGIKLNLDYLVAVNNLVVEQTYDKLKESNCTTFISDQGMRALKNKDISKLIPLFTRGPWTFETDLEKPINNGFTVTFVALQLAFYLGFKEVVLIGVDHNFVQKGKPNETQVLNSDDINHFDPDYFKGQKWMLADLEGSEVSFHMAKYHFEHNGRSVVDATVNGKLNVFPKVDFATKLNEVTRKN